MRSISILFLSAVGLAVASAAGATVTYTVEATTSLGSRLDALQSGEQIVLDVTARSAEPFFAIGISAFGYDASIVSFSSAVLPESLFVALGTGPGTGIGGIVNDLLPQPPVEVDTNPAGAQVRLFGTALASSANQTGENDISPIDGTVGGPQIRLVFDYIGPVGAFTTIGVGSDRRFGDGVSIPELVDGVNAFVTVGRPVPEPGTALLLALGLAGLCFDRRPDAPRR